MLARLFDSVREHFGYPATLDRMLTLDRLAADEASLRFPLDLPKPCVAMASVVPWHNFAEARNSWLHARVPGRLTGWRQSGRGDCRMFTIHRPDIIQLGQCEVIENWTCDITDVHGFSASKSDLWRFGTTDQMVETNSREMIDEISEAKLAENLAHRENSSILKPGINRFCRHAWDGRVFLINSNGSHHFAAAKYIAARLGKPVEVRGQLQAFSLDTRAIASLRRDFEIFVVAGAAAESTGFNQAMQAFGATWLWHPMPRPYQASTAVLLPRAEPRSLKVAELLRSAGVVDLGKHLSDIASR